MLFDPQRVGNESLGVAGELSTTVTKCDLELRKELWGNILLSGGVTLTRSRLTSRLREAAAGRDQAAGAAEHTLARAVAAGPRALGVEWRVRADVAEPVR